jgi:hypothetical protein
MKKIALATLLALAAVTASAVEVGFEYQDQIGTHNGPKSDNYQLTVKEAINSNFAVDVKTFEAVARDNNSEQGVTSTQLETGVTAKYDIMGLSPYTRLAVGNRSVTTQSYAYYSVEPGVSAPLGTTGLTASLGWRFRTPFSNVDAFETRTWRTALGYSLTKKDNIYIGYDRMRGDTNAGLTRVGYTHSF